MSDLRKAAQQALEALEAGPDVDPIFAGETEAALRAALAQQAEPGQEPVAWNWMLDGRPYGQVYYGNPPDADIAERAAIAGRTVRLLYTAPPQRQDQRVEKLEAQRDALKQTLHDELAGNLRLRDLGGARPDEPMLTFLERIIAERAALLGALKMIAGELPCIDNLMSDKDIARAAILAAEEGK